MQFFNHDPGVEFNCCNDRDSPFHIFGLTNTFKVKIKTVNKLKNLDNMKNAYKKHTISGHFFCALTVSTISKPT